MAATLSATAQDAVCNADDVGYSGAACKSTLTQAVAIGIGSCIADACITVSGGSVVLAGPIAFDGNAYFNNRRCLTAPKPSSMAVSLVP